MIEEIIKAYKCYNTSVKLGYILFAMGILLTFIFIGVAKIVGYTDVAISTIYIISIVMISIISPGGYSHWIRNNYGYGKFIRSIKNPYGKLKIAMIISFFKGIVFYLIYLFFLKIIFIILKIEEFFNLYQIFYGAILGVVLLGISQILSYYIKNEKNDAITSTVIYGIIGGVVSQFTVKRQSVNFINTPKTAIFSFIVAVIYLLIIYTIIFKRIRNRWWVQ
ncbi:hypothetical protein [Clostridium hydrogenum]|uniref:hypothetical protein n=1 Tax=Clostridium hydrogenum TaxID=2855764 RepID=UPI001F227282|nr:hypothetical protein [Clostridium hydrogenum]